MSVETPVRSINQLVLFSVTVIDR